MPVLCWNGCRCEMVNTVTIAMWCLCPRLICEQCRWQWDDSKWRKSSAGMSQMKLSISWQRHRRSRDRGICIKSIWNWTSPRIRIAFMCRHRSRPVWRATTRTSNCNRSKMVRTPTASDMKDWSARTSKIRRQPTIRMHSSLKSTAAMMPATKMPFPTIVCTTKFTLVAILAITCRSAWAQIRHPFISSRPQRIWKFVC